MDPISITTSVIGTVAVALHSARRVNDFIDGIQGAPHAVSALSKDLQALKNVLETLNTFVNHVHLSGETARSDFIPLLKPPLENCATVLESIILAVKPYTKPSGEPNKSKWRGFVWTFREREVVILQKTLMDYKMSLDIAISVANLTTSSDGLTDVKKSIRGMRQRLNEDRDSISNSSFSGSGTVGTDHGYALRRYLLETETVLGDSPPFGPGTPEPEPPIPDPEDDQSVDDGTPVHVAAQNGHHQSLRKLFEVGDKADALGPRAPGNQLLSHAMNVDPRTPSNQPQSHARNIEPRVASNHPWEDTPPPSPSMAPGNFGASSSRSRADGLRTNLPPLRPVFGVSLDELFRRDGSAVPMVVYQCVQAVDLFGLDAEGIYRISGSAPRITEMKAMFDNDSSKADFRNPAAFHFDIASVTTLLKHFLRDLPDPLLTSAKYASFITSAKVDDDIFRRDALHALINSLPDPNYATLRVLTLHLHRVSEHSQHNRMTPSNLAICFGPILMGQQGHSSGQDIGGDIIDAGWRARVVQTILNNTFQIFDDD